MAWRIRQAGYADLEAAARAKALSWGESLGGVVTDEALRRQLEPQWLDRAADHWRGVLDGGGYVWLVVDDGGEVAGVAHASLGRDDDAPTPLELVTIYLREAAQGSGVADALLAMTIGDAPAYLWGYSPETPGLRASTAATASPRMAPDSPSMVSTPPRNDGSGWSRGVTSRRFIMISR